MKMNFAKNCLVVAVTGLLSAGAMAQEKAQSLDQLLNMVKKSQINESSEHKKREAEFRRQKAGSSSCWLTPKAPA